MYILTRRSAPSENGLVSHAIYGRTVFIGEARAWFRGTRVTDVVEIPEGTPWISEGREGNTAASFISEKRLPSWREEQYQHDLELAKLGLKK